eukprot:GHVO01044785.1.p1 GENE.GHVO01044785.1~~GHVO01044785.1.p1  ORF type:complete len:422 (+),score=51.99 GHVO01044785.1:38-1303(+)
MVPEPAVVDEHPMSQAHNQIITPPNTTQQTTDPSHTPTASHTITPSHKTTPCITPTTPSPTPTTHTTTSPAATFGAYGNPASVPVWATATPHRETLWDYWSALEDIHEQYGCWISGTQYLKLDGTPTPGLPDGPTFDDLEENPLPTFMSFRDLVPPVAPDALSVPKLNEWLHNEHNADIGHDAIRCQVVKTQMDENIGVLDDDDDAAFEKVKDDLFCDRDVLGALAEYTGLDTTMWSLRAACMDWLKKKGDELYKQTSLLICPLKALDDRTKPSLFGSILPAIQKAWKPCELWRQNGVVCESKAREVALGDKRDEKLTDMRTAAVCMYWEYTRALTEITQATEEAIKTHGVEKIVKASLQALYPTARLILQDWILSRGSHKNAAYPPTVDTNDKHRTEMVIHLKSLVQSYPVAAVTQVTRL